MTSNGYLDREGLVGKSARRYRDVELPGGGKVRIQSLTEREKSSYESSILDPKGNVKLNKLEQARRRLICMTVVDGKGERIFSGEDVNSEDLQNMDGGVAQAIFAAAKEHCAFDQDDIEELAKNSEGIPVA